MNPSEKPSYAILGVSHQKEDVHAALKNSDQGLFPDAFCKIIPDTARDPKYCSILHADGAGTKSSLAYMMYKETGDLKYFKGIAQDSTVMNIDDVLCVGANEYFLLSNTIGRNKKIISGDIIYTIIQGYESFLTRLREFGVNILSCGGETADVGDLVRTIICDSTLVARMKRSDVITAKNAQPGDVIVGLSSFGQTKYEDSYNSGMGSNGLTLARHGVLHHDYFSKYPECFSPEIEEKWVFFGQHHFEDSLQGTSLTIGEALLSPTRTYAPLLMKLFSEPHQDIHTIYHNTGGGQSKCLKFGKGLHYIKDNLFNLPSLFKMIQKSSQTDWKEMYQVFNMGHRMEIICPASYATEKVIPMAKSLGIDAQIIGHIEKSPIGSKNTLTINGELGNFKF
ncbi:MAG: AIR synthase-related protein [Promethearchaeota archaeon]